MYDRTVKMEEKGKCFFALSVVDSADRFFSFSNYLFRLIYSAVNRKKKDENMCKFILSPRVLGSIRWGISFVIDTYQIFKIILDASEAHMM